MKVRVRLPNCAQAIHPKHRKCVRLLDAAGYLWSVKGREMRPLQAHFLQRVASGDSDTISKRTCGYLIVRDGLKCYSAK
jgi:hypothetical protein